MKHRPPQLRGTVRTLRHAVLILCSAALPALAQTYPVKPIRFIVPFPAGGAGDLVVRLLAQKTGERWHQPVVVDPRAGASGVVGLQIAAAAPPDGYTLVLGTASTHSINPALQPGLPYDPVKDFAAVASLIAIPNAIVAYRAVPARNLQELIQLARAKPGQLAYASNGTGTSSHMAAEFLMRSTGIKLLHVPYKGAGNALNDVLGGHVQLLIGAVSTSLPHVHAGRLTAIAVTGAQRSPAAPDVPTVAESGFPGFEVVQWFGAFAPAATPRDIVAIANAGLNRALGLPDVQETFTRQGFEIRAWTPAQFATYVKAELAKWTKIIREAGLRAE